MTRQRYQGRLELTWTNKGQRLLAGEDGSYEWVPPGDYRVAEVRLLHDVDTVGEVRSDGQRAKDNLLIQGDALNALTSLIELPELARKYVGKVKLVYIDPPFNTQQAFEHYDDALEHSVWLTMLRDRLIQVRALLSPEGSVWVHCDDSEQHRLRVVMDEVFGPASFVATVVWEKRYSRSNDAGVSVSHDYLHVYAPDSRRWAQSRNRLPRSPSQAKQYRNPDNDPLGPWRTIPWDAPEIRENLGYPITTPSGAVRYPPPGRHWSGTEDRWLEIVSRGRAHFGRDGSGSPAVKRYLFEAPGIVPNTWWAHEEVGHNDEAKKEIMDLFPDVPAFATPKPERLLARIIEIATNPRDIVLDCFVGSGTSAAVAHKLGRRWVAIERSVETVDTFALPRLAKVIAAEDAGGITEVASWEGGGGFRVMEVAPPMFVEHRGAVVLADWATNGALAEATAAQLGYDYQPEPPFAGRRANKRLAVVDGRVGAAAVEFIAGLLGDRERVAICGTSIDPDTRELLKELSPGSTLRKIPSSILRDYQIRSRESRVIPRREVELVEAPAR